MFVGRTLVTGALVVSGQVLLVEVECVDEAAGGVVQLGVETVNTLVGSTEWDVVW